MNVDHKSIIIIIRATKNVTRKQNRTAVLMEADAASAEKKRKKRRERTPDEIALAEADWAGASVIGSSDEGDESIVVLPVVPTVNHGSDVDVSDKDDGADVWAMMSKRAPGTPSPFRGAGSLLLVVIIMVQIRGQVIWTPISPVSKNVFGYLRCQDEWFPTLFSG